METTENAPLLALFDEIFKDNQTNDISPEDLRIGLKHLVFYIDSKTTSTGFPYSLPFDLISQSA